jgi:hypothetical protein
MPVAEPKDVILGILGASVSLAGLLLVFVGFVYSHAETFGNIVRRDRYRLVSRFGLVPFTGTLICAWLCIDWLAGDQRLYWLALESFRGGVLLTAVYGLVTLLWYL